MRVMMHSQRNASRRNSCSQLSAFVGSNRLQGQPPPAVLAWLENPVLSHHVAHDIEALSARSALFEPRAGGQGGVIASML